MYKHIMLKQEKRRGVREWTTTDTCDLGNSTEENIQKATCKETMRFFKQFGKQRIIKKVVNGKAVLRIESYYNQDPAHEYRNVHIYTEI